MKNIKIVMALPQESQGLFEKADAPIVFTGIGKVNAAFAVTKLLFESRSPKVDLVLNLGTAGSTRFAHGSLIECTEFVQRDMDLSGIGVPKGETPFDPIPGNVRVDRLFPTLPEGICGTGDSFDMTGAAAAYNVVDMEAFALAKTCHHLGVKFASIKYITDGADDSAHSDWRENLKPASRALFQIYQDFMASLRS